MFGNVYLEDALQKHVFFSYQEWVAALPDVPGDTDLNQPEPPGSSQDLDTLSLGAEGKELFLQGRKVKRDETMFYF